MTVDVDRTFPTNLRFVADTDRRVTLADLRGKDKAVALFFMRAASCAICMRHVKELAGMDLARQGVRSVVVVPGEAKNAARVRRTAGAGVTVVSSADAEAHRAVGLNRTLMMQHSGTLLVGSEGTVRYRLTGAMPTGSFDRKELLEAINAL